MTLSVRSSSGFYNFISDKLKENNEVLCFTERDGVFYKVINIKEGAKDIAFNPIYPNALTSEYQTTQDPRFMHCVWLLKNMEQKLYFPECSNKIMMTESVNLLNSYTKRDVIIYNHHTNKEEELKNSTLYICRESFLEFVKALETKNKKTNGNRKSENNFIKYLQQQIKENPNQKLFPKTSKTNDSYRSIAEEKYQIIKLRRFNYCWTEATKNLPKDNCWIKSGRPKKQPKKS